MSCANNGDEVRGDSRVTEPAEGVVRVTMKERRRFVTRCRSGPRDRRSSRRVHLRKVHGWEEGGYSSLVQAFVTLGESCVVSTHQSMDFAF